jgi:capsid portal protein
MNKGYQNFSVVNLAQQDIPVITEDVKTRYSWVPFGIGMQDNFYPEVTAAYQTSTTNAACIEGISDLIFGKGLYTKNESFTDQLSKLLPQEETKRVIFDLKLYGNGAYQVIWNDDHTKVIKFYHIPVQTLRAEKIYDNPKIENYYYCTDWYDMKAQKHKKKIPAFGTSNENREILWVKNYTPGKYYYSTPDWISALQFSFVEAELSNLHINNIENGFLPMVMVNMNNGIPAPEERDTIESLIESKFTGTRNAGRFMISFNDDAANKPTIDTIQIENLHEKFQYVADYAQDRILVAHRITSPLLFGIRTANNGFSSQSEEMKTAYSIMQTMTVNPFQNLIINTITSALDEGGWEGSELYFEQLTPLAILSTTAEETGQTVAQVEDDVNKQMENPETQEDTTDDISQMSSVGDDELSFIRNVGTKSAFFEREYK